MNHSNKFWLNTITKILSLATIAVAFFVIYIVSLTSPKGIVTDSPVASQATDEVKVAESSFKIAFMGDMLAHKSISDEALQPDGSYDYTSLVSDQLINQGSSHDLMYCNQEVSTASSKPVKGYPLFNADIDFVNFMDNLGCNIIGFANNHSYDNGQNGIDETIQSWGPKDIKASSGISSSLEDSDKLNIIKHEGLKIGFTSFAQYSNTVVPNTYSVNLLGDSNRLSQQMEGLRAASDIVVVAVHWGTENSHSINSNQQDWAQKIADQGADIIVGTGPHVVQPYQTITSKDGRQTHVWFSIGNAINAQANIDQLISGIFSLTITEKSGQQATVHSPKVLPTLNTFNMSASGQITGHRYMLLNEAHELLSSARFNTSYNEQVKLLQSYLGPNVEVLN